MDLTGQDLHVIAFLSSAQDTLERAKSIISLAESNPDHAKTLSACATILLATALEQAVKTLFSKAAETAAFENEIPVSKTEPAEYDDQSIWWRVQSLPSVLSEQKFRLAHNHTLTKALGELIRARNTLVHVDEPAVHLVGPNDQIKIEDGRIRVSFEQPLSPWACVKLEKVKTFQMAVDAYFTEVLFPESGHIKEGTIVVPRR